MLLLANSCHMLCDLHGAIYFYDKLISRGYEVDLVKSEIEKVNNKVLRLCSVNVFCDDKPLQKIIKSLVPVFNRIKKDLYVYVVNDEEEYHNVLSEKFDMPSSKVTIAYKDFRSVGLYENPAFHLLIFKRVDLEKCTKTQIIGMCAHEIAHLELHDTEMRAAFNKFSGFTKENTFFNERLTDLYVLSKGFAYELYEERKGSQGNFNGSISYYIMSKEEIEDYIRYISYL